MTYPITELYAWIVDDPTETHGIVAFRMPDGAPAQAVTSKRHIADKLKPHADRVARMTGLPVKLQRFAFAETVETLPS